MESAHTQRRVAKRSSNACSRCRRQKIKCSGLQPCDGCSKRKLTCIFDERDNKILVTQGYISNLQQKIARLEHRQAGVYSPPESNHVDQDANRAVTDSGPEAGVLQYDEPALDPQSGAQGTHYTSPSRAQMESEASDLTNPLTTTPSTFMSASNGRMFYLGTSSNWSFSRRVLSMTHEHVYKAPLPTAALLFDGSAYDLGWDGSRSTPGPGTLVIPSLDYAIYLINAVKFHCGQLFHLSDEEDFMASLHKFYSDSDGRIEKAGLWYIHFLLMLAFGKIFILQKNQGRRPSGADFFVKALQLLPDVSALCREPIVSTEILCCIALYLQSLDFRHSAHNFIGQAMRMALAHGMHTDMPISHLGEHLVQRCRKIWWTVYILDRQMTSLMGLPQSVRDDDVYCQLPSFSGSIQRTAALSMQIKLARIIAEINSTIYGMNGRLNKKFLISTKAALESIAGLADELRQSFPLLLDEPFGGVSRMSAHLHLLYHQCIVLATRPLLFCCLKIRFESPPEIDSLIASRKVRSLLLMCTESSQQILNILDSLQVQGLLETFLPFDLDSLFVSTMVLLVGRVVDPRLLESRSPWLQKSYTMFEEMVSGGNLIADFRRSEVQRLDEMLSDLSTAQSQTLSGSVVLPQSGGLHQTHSRVPLQSTMPSTASLPLCQDILPPHPDIGNDSSYGDDLTAEQIMAVANSIESEDAEWISRAMIENSIWDIE
ncbi:Zn(II)2Cys6 transcription factor [Zopfia rhizophila CBS 207.26]|uniref:Zn(II)2Cys6 transcription factor n=1 Tax=Zopfia rhizophila CBS 207.26 TaxID=1314779 RepID=A0A6A6EUX1_9PEZI|nr:Zn(II)2Cys6 transcription factor [Zopfia rhizophila CBS 207.26]